MAIRRSIHTSISLSESVEAMSEWAQLLWDRVFAHADDFGLLEGSPAKVKGRCKPLSKRDPQDFAAAIVEMVEHGMLETFEAGGRVFLRVLNFERFQTGLHKRTESRFPTSGTLLTSDQYLALALPEIPGKSSLVCAGGREEKRREEKRENSNEFSLSDSESDDGAMTKETRAARESVPEPLIRFAEDYNALRREWSLPEMRVSSDRLKKHVAMYRRCLRDLRQADATFDFALLLRRVREQHEFFRDWTGWDLAWLLGTKKGSHNALKVWERRYSSRSSPQRNQQIPLTPAQTTRLDKYEIGKFDPARHLPRK